MPPTIYILLRNWISQVATKTSFLSYFEFAIANVQCQYDGSDSEKSEGSIRTTGVTGEHNYDTRDEPPAFIIQQVTTPPTSQSKGPFVEVRPTIMTIGPGYGPSVNVIHVGDRPPTSQSQGPEFNMNKRIRRSEVELRQAADCVSRGLTFQTVSEQFNIPISTIRFFMARKGILPRRRRGRSAQFSRQSISPEPPFHMQHFKLPNMLALPAEDDPPQT